MANSAKQKGSRGEYEIRDLLQPIVDRVHAELGFESPEIKRNLEQVRAGGHDLVGLDWLAIEVKRQETLHLDKWWQQTIDSASKCSGTVFPVLVYRQNRQKWRVQMMAWLDCGDHGHHARTELSLDDFLVWFEKRLRYQLTLE